MKKLIALTLAGLLSLPASFALAESIYPNAPVRIIVGYAPGTTIDLLSRVLSAELSTELKQPVVVENLPGAAGMTATNSASIAQPDGYSLYLAPVGFVINPLLYPNVKYDPFESFAPVMLVAGSANVLVANKDLPVETVADLIELAKSRPGEIKYATSGKGSSAYLNMELFKSMAGLDMVEVSYQVSSQAVVDTISGQTSVIFPSLGATLPQIRSGQLKPLGVSSATRSAIAPDIPTVGETIEGFDASSWYGIVTQAGTPAEIIGKLNSAMSATLAKPEVVSKLRDLGLDIVASTPEAFAAVLRDDFDKWKELADELGIAAANR